MSGVFQLDISDDQLQTELVGGHRRSLVEWPSQSRPDDSRSGTVQPITLIHSDSCDRLVSSNVLISSNVNAVRRAHLVLERLTVYTQAGKPSKYVTGLLRQLSLAIPTMMLCDWEGNHRSDVVPHDSEFQTQ